MIKKAVVGIVAGTLIIAISACGPKKIDENLITGSLPEVANKAIEQYESKRQESIEMKQTIETPMESESNVAKKRFIDITVDEGYKENDLYGILKIQDVGIEVSLYWGNPSGDPDGVQKIVDKNNSAAYIHYGVEHIVVDHDYQGFDQLEKVIVGKTEAEISFPDGTLQTYKCSRICNGTNDGRIYDENGEDISVLTDGGLAIYTCLDSSETIFLTFWEKSANRN